MRIGSPIRILYTKHFYRPSELRCIIAYVKVLPLYPPNLALNTQYVGYMSVVVRPSLYFEVLPFTILRGVQGNYWKCSIKRMV